jgi:hypothetical protein
VKNYLHLIFCESYIRHVKCAGVCVCVVYSINIQNRQLCFSFVFIFANKHYNTVYCLFLFDIGLYLFELPISTSMKYLLFIGVFFFKSFHDSRLWGVNDSYAYRFLFLFLSRLSLFISFYLSLYLFLLHILHFLCSLVKLSPAQRK